MSSKQLMLPGPTDCFAAQRLLDRLPATMADTARAFLLAMTPTRYASFLDTMYHYTRHSGARFRHAARLCHDESLQKLLEHLADIHGSHFRLAESDLRALGLAPTNQVPKAVRAFDTSWASLALCEPTAIARTRGTSPIEQWAWAGAVSVILSASALLKDDALGVLRRLDLRGTKTRFLEEHLTADERHAASSCALCRHQIRGQSSAILRGARTASAHWIEIYRAALVLGPRQVTPPQPAS
jgi:hypothetical protein